MFPTGYKPLRVEKSCFRRRSESECVGVFNVPVRMSTGHYTMFCQKCARKARHPHTMKRFRESDRTTFLLQRHLQLVYYNHIVSCEREICLEPCLSQREYRVHFDSCPCRPRSIHDIIVNGEVRFDGTGEGYFNWVWAGFGNVHIGQAALEVILFHYRDTVVSAGLLKKFELHLKIQRAFELGQILDMTLLKIDFFTGFTHEDCVDCGLYITCLFLHANDCKAEQCPAQWCNEMREVFDMDSKQIWQISDEMKKKVKDVIIAEWKKVRERQQVILVRDIVDDLLALTV
ncbi:Protein CBG26854 [Caenorhabditis briggsae]|uniref:Protein CBG26854 n=1 Tax=Caenorhabditis briggsae TaxID=6238 RepID=B6IM05_CAEBR|nr:Protein CBG26854 [Caenorhabditis briggsae]CAS00935.1 Protein CBG26854 [Caenorhabditis briggsae]